MPIQRLRRRTREVRGETLSPLNRVAIRSEGHAKRQWHHAQIGFVALILVLGIAIGVLLASRVKMIG